MLNLFNWNESQIYTFFFLLTRVTSLVIFLPIFGDRSVPEVIKIFFGLAISFVAFPLVWAQGSIVPASVMESTGRTVWALCCEIGFGVMVGFVARWIFDAVQVAGHFAGTSVGFSIATVLDPHTESQTTALAETYYILAALLFLSMDGHHILLSAILESFKVVPLSKVDFLAQGDGAIQYIIRMTSEVIGLGLKLSAPVVVVTLLINLTFGIMARAVPQMNVIAVSFTANIVIGLFVVLVGLPGFVNMVGGAFDSYASELSNFMRLFRG